MLTRALTRLAFILSICFITGYVNATTVNVTANAVDTVVNGNCSLIEAIQAAETDTAVDACPAGSGADTINVPAGTYTLTVVNNGGGNPNGLPIVTTAMTIVGAGAAATIITRGGATTFRFFSLSSTGNLTLNGVTLSNGNSTTSGHDGGAIFNSGGTLTVLNSTLSGNVSGGGGGAIFNRFPFAGSPAIANLTSSTLSGNSGGAALQSLGTVTVTNSTLSGNAAGGIANRGTLTVSYSTIASNTGNTSFGGADAGIFQDGNSATTTLNNTIVANNTNNANCNISAGTLTNGGNNLQFPGITCGAGITTADPLLGPVANNGGGTQTMALLAGSPAIDAANSALCPATDQRGIARPQGPSCDIGAFEHPGGVGPLPLPNATIPTMDSWGLFTLAILLALAAGWGHRKQRH